MREKFNYFILKAIYFHVNVEQTLDFDSVFGVPSTLLFIFWAWLSFPSIPKSGPGDIPMEKIEDHDLQFKDFTDEMLSFQPGYVA